METAPLKVFGALSTHNYLILVYNFHELLQNQTQYIQNHHTYLRQQDDASIH